LEEVSSYWDAVEAVKVFAVGIAKGKLAVALDL
jgi:hypothetical protein